MRYFIFLLLLPLFAHAQTDTSVVYRQSYKIKGRDKESISNYTTQFITKQQGKFFYLYSYSKQDIDKSIDTSQYGHYIVNGNIIIVKCLFAYVAASVDIVEGDIVFTSRDNEANMRLQNVRYSKYEQQKGKWRETQRGYYKDLKLCKHCNVTGIKLAETVNKGFIKLSLAYEKYLKQVR